MEQEVKKDIFDFYNDMMGNKFDCLLIQTEQGDHRIERSIVYYTRRIVVSIDEKTNKETREWAIEPHVLVTSKGNEKIDEELDIDEIYRTLIGIMHNNGFATIEFVSPAIVINSLAIEQDENGKMIYSESKKKLISKFKNGKRELTKRTSIKLSEKDDIFIVFKDGLTLERKHKQPTRLGSFLFDREPSYSEKQKLRNAEFDFRKDQAEREAAERAKIDRKARLVRIAHKVLEKQRAKKKAEEKELEKEAKKQAKEIVDDQGKEA